MICPNTGYTCNDCTAPCAPKPKPIPALPPHQQGWQCPKCGRGNAPWNATCPCGPEFHVITTTGTIPGGA
jgi:DNA-directed RNA polymerase subunit RPC12/RpoP